MRHLIIYNIPSNMESIYKAIEYVEATYSDMESSNINSVMDSMQKEKNSILEYADDIFLIARKHGTRVLYGYSSKKYYQNNHNSYPYENFNKIDFDSLLIDSTSKLRERYR